MKWERNQNQGKFILKVNSGRRGYFLTSGSTCDERGQSKPSARTTMRISEAMSFKTAKSAEAMRRLLHEQYGLETTVMKWERRYDA